MKTSDSRPPLLPARLARICEHCPHLSNEVIDLHLSSQRRCSPGQCAKALFRISQEAADALSEEVAALFAVIPRDLVVEARGPEGEIFEQLPFEPALGEDLESYCKRIMDLFFWDRKPTGFPLHLQFSYA